MQIGINYVGVEYKFSIRIAEGKVKGKSYKAIAIPFEENLSMGVLGQVEDGWIVISCLTGKAYLFQRSGGVLTDDYIQEKLGGSNDDYPEFAALIRFLINRPLTDLTYGVSIEVIGSWR